MGGKVRANVGRSQGSEIAGRDSQVEIRNFRFGMRGVCVDGACRKLPAHIMVVIRTCRLRLPGWFTCPNRNWPIQASVVSRASAAVADCSQSLSRKYEAAQHPDPPNPPPRSSASPPLPTTATSTAATTTPPATLLPLSLPLFNTPVVSTARSSPLPARCRLRDLALGSLDCCPMQLGLSIATTHAGSECPSIRHYCGVRLWRDREIYTCRSLMNPIHVACFLVILRPRLGLAFFAT